MGNRFDEVYKDQFDNYIYPFLWMHGEDHAILTEELERIKESNIKAICVEARPHPDFGGEQWWSDMDVVMDFARKNDMKVWLLDDDRFPTGHANKAFSDGNNELSNEFLTSWSTDVVGPIKNSAMIVQPVLKSDSKLIGAVACKRVSGDTTELDLGSCIDLTGNIKNGWLRFDVPEGLWRILLFFTTHQGDGKLDYFNILNSESVRLLLDRVFEPHFERYGEDFGKTFTGFFSDEQEFANLPGYDFQARLGKNMKFIPWSGELYARLQKRWGDSLVTRLPALWYDAMEQTGHIRFEYMDEVTKQLKHAFSDQVGDWCKAHGVIHVGHIIEDDNSHGRLGCSTGHYFRSSSGMGMAGIDVVLLQIMPGMNQVIHQWVASDRDGEFFHYGLGKMGSSLAHIDREKNGNAMCEIFGAFGWQEGISLMKWLADHMLSRGINYFVPHAFSPRSFPDLDCPPHFYARGNHPQFKYFGQLMKYMNRAAHLLTGGNYLAQIAVLYHAEAEWAGEAMLFQKPVRVFLENQMECDVIPADVFSKKNPYHMTFDGRICIGKQSYEALVVPYSEYLPEEVARAVAALIEKGFPVFFVGGYPEKICESIPGEKQLLKGLGAAEEAGLEDLAFAVAGRINPRVRIKQAFPDLRTYTYRNDYGVALYCFNESTTQSVDSQLGINLEESYEMAVRYDPWNNIRYALPLKREEGRLTVPLQLECGEAAILLFQKEAVDLPVYKPWPKEGARLDGEWSISYSDIVGYPAFRALAECKGGDGLPDLTDWAVEQKFCGMLRYETSITSEQDRAACLRLRDGADAVEIYVNGASAGMLSGAPYCMELPLVKGKNQLIIELAVTPVWSVGDDWSSLTVLPPLGLIQKPYLTYL